MTGAEAWEEMVTERRRETKDEREQAGRIQEQDAAYEGVKEESKLPVRAVSAFASSEGLEGVGGLRKRGCWTAKSAKKGQKGRK